MSKHIDDTVDSINKALDENDRVFVDGHLAYRFDELDSELDDLESFIEDDLLDQAVADRISAERRGTSYLHAERIA